MQRELLGYLYCDIDGAFGRFHDGDRDLLAMLASQAAVALANVRFAAGLERKVVERTAELEQRAGELTIINSIQRGLAGALELQAIIELVGDKLHEVFGADVVGIALLDRERDLKSYPYLLDHGERFQSPPEPNGSQTGIGGVVLRTGQTIVFNTVDEVTAFQDAHGIEDRQLGGPTVDQSFVYAPLASGGDAMGLICIGKQPPHAFAPTDVNLITTVAASLSVALQNALSFQAERQRNAELAVINSIQQGMAGSLDFQGIIDLVGDKLRDVMHTEDIGISWYDHQPRLAHSLYVYEHGRRLFHKPHPIRPGGPGERLLATRQPVVLNRTEELRAVAGEAIPGTDMAKCAVWVPILGSDQVLGAVQIENHEREHAFGDSEVRLLQTVASSMGVALQSARLFDETQRLLKETEQRAAEMAVINSIQQGIAAELNFQAIVDLVGDKLREVLKTQDIGIRLINQTTGMVHYLYEFEHGKRLEMPPAMPKPGGPGERMRETRAPVVFNSRAELDASGIGVVPGTDVACSVAFVPIISGDRTTGSLLLENHEREYAFGESEVRLLQTVASSMGVALENARLFGETQRLLKETEQRNAELAVINSIQQGMAGSLDFKGIVDLVGDKLRDVFGTGDIGIGWNDYRSGQFLNIYAYEHGHRLDVAPMPLEERHTTRRGPLVYHTAAEQIAAGNIAMEGTDQSQSYASVQIIGGDHVLGRVQLENHQREHAFGDAEIRLLETVASSMGVALENARLFDETQRLLKETEQRAAEMAVINSIQQGIAGELSFQAIVDLVGDKLREVLNTGDIDIVWYEPQTGLLHCLYSYEHGRRLNLPPRPAAAGGLWEIMVQTRRAQVYHTVAEQLAGGISTEPGTDQQLSLARVPIIGSDRVLGSLTMWNHEREHAFGESEVRLLTTVASSMGVALENARLFEEIQRRTRESAALAEVGRDISSTLDLPTVMDRIAHHAKELLAADHSAIFLPDSTNAGGAQSFRAIVAEGEDAAQVKDLVIVAGEGIIGSIIANGRAEYVNDTGS